MTPTQSTDGREKAQDITPEQYADPRTLPVPAWYFIPETAGWGPDEWVYRTKPFTHISVVVATRYSLSDPTATPPPSATPVEQGSAGETARYYWKQCYEVGDSVHWALCDTASDAERPHRVSCAYMVLLADYPNAIGGRPVSEEPMLVRIINALNQDQTLIRLNGELVTKLKQCEADRDREAAKVDKLDAELASLRCQLEEAKREVENLTQVDFKNADLIDKLQEERDFAQGEVIVKGAACASLRDKLNAAQDLMREAADSVHASLAETDISDDRKRYREGLEARLRAPVMPLSTPAPVPLQQQIDEYFRTVTPEQLEADLKRADFDRFNKIGRVIESAPVPLDAAVKECIEELEYCVSVSCHKSDYGQARLDKAKAAQILTKHLGQMGGATDRQKTAELHAQEILEEMFGPKDDNEPDPYFDDLVAYLRDKMLPRHPLVQGAREDTRRLDWLEAQEGEGIHTLHLSQVQGGGMGRNWFKKQIRAAIDKAMEESK